MIIVGGNLISSQLLVSTIDIIMMHDVSLSLFQDLDYDINKNERHYLLAIAIQL